MQIVHEMKTEVVNGQPNRPFVEYAPIEVIDVFGNTYACFRDNGDAYSFVKELRDDETNAFYAYGQRIGTVVEILKQGFDYYNSKAMDAYELYEAANTDWSKV